MKWVGALTGLIIFTEKKGVHRMKEERIQEMVDSLMRFRGRMDESERELFDMLMVYANEVALTIDGTPARS